ncbi:MAG: DUF4124 domain-containing protein [Gammaproteobacteria bacterium]|nr:DUF4124 domain-containing protein [Gammaproteobacteria bacterium]MBU1656040.1 DUF4124 domain-containing protein [Gammaproteobacteria bacterium]MBU1960281.1 DUF4124 domain-containing protein [Gammaproteobacteria bacterium]
MNKMMILPLLALPVLGVHAAMYKWTDANGKTVYSQHPPPSGTSERIQTAPTPSQSVTEAQKRLQEQLQRIEDRREDRHIAGDKDRAANTRAGLMARNCETARKNLESLGGPPNRVTRMADGSYKRLTPEERQKQIDEANKQIQENCR